ncbi:hypothetical protein ACHAXT_011878 [Thalassiosira profunda]
MGSTLEAVRKQRQFAPPNNTQRWAVGSIVAVFLAAFAAIGLQSLPRTAHILAGTKSELALIVAVAAFACGAVGTATNPATGMAVNAASGVSFGNLYYSTWATFACAAGLLLSFLRTERGLDVSSQLKSRGRRFRLWAILIIANLIVMGSSASAYDAKCGDDEEMVPIKYCRRAAFGVSAGCIGCVGSLACVAMRVSCTRIESGEARPNKLVFGVECIAGLMLLCFYCFAVAYLTSEEGPGAPLGNLFYSTWVSFGLICFVGTSLLEEYQAAKSIYKQENRPRSIAASAGDVSSLQTQGADWTDNEHSASIDHHRPILHGVQQASMPVAQRTGSVGEVSIQD